MRVAFFCLTCVIGLAGCMSPFRPDALIFPVPETKSFRAPDGRTWKLVESQPELGGEYRLRYIPSDGDPSHWMEKLEFAISGPHMSMFTQRKGFEDARARVDRSLEFRFEGDDDEYVQTFYSPDYGQRSICRVVRSERGYVSIEYRERLGPSGKKRLGFWTEYITQMPNQVTYRQPR